nr:AI-2E family transporter [uncultured Gellertiella sp.]
MAIHITGNILKRQVVFWIVILALLYLFLMTFRTVLLPFVAGMVLAYFLDPVADWLERRGLSRMMATVVILLTFLLSFVVALIIIIPLVAGQVSDLAARVPDYAKWLQSEISADNLQHMPKWLVSQVAVIQANASKFLGEGAVFASAVFAQIWDSSKTIIDIVSLLLITPVVAFYVLLDWDRMVAKVDSWVPRDNVAEVREIAAEMDRAIAGFVRGQGSLCLILGLYYGVSLTLVGLNFGLLIGLFVGMIAFIPYIGSMVGLGLSLGVATLQFWPNYWMPGIVLGIFLFGQFVEGNILQPKLVGKSVGLHPVWLMFALLAFGALFGFVGLLVAVPAAAAIGVLVRFAINRYLESELYDGRNALEQPVDRPAAITGG